MDITHTRSMSLLAPSSGSKHRTEVGPKKSYQNHLARGESERSMVSAPTTSPDDWLTAYATTLDGKAAGTVV